MSPLFGKKGGERTFVVLDVESGSVASALVRVSPGQQAKLFADTRMQLPLLQTRSASTLAAQAQKFARQALAHASLVAARIRGNDKLAPVGNISGAVIFLSAPWTTLKRGSRGLEWQHEDTLAQALRGEVEALFGQVPVTIEPFGAAALGGVQALFPESQDFLVCNLGGEVAELLLMQGGAARAHATVPLGHELIGRTLRSHGGLSAAEARSALELVREQGTPAREHLAPTLQAAAEHFTQEFGRAAGDIVGPNTRHIFITAPEPMGEWFGLWLSGPSLGDIFPEGGEVRALRASHLGRHVAAHGPAPDLLLALEALHVDKGAGEFGI